MARYGQRPENALKRANEFMEIGKPARALDTLQEVFRNKKWSYNWSESVLEPIMFRYLELCVELRKSHIAKEGLFQYRNMFQSVNVGSLENVIRGYLKMAEQRTEAARKQSAQAVIDIDDLDNLATPESILLSAVSGEDAQDRSDRTILTPWVKFLWESYCQCLELLRTNAHVENLYHDIARMAFQFCLKYARKTEFRKLCDKLRKHLEDICKLSVRTGNVSISKPETQQFNLETRLFQLDSAIQMELWQEAYKAIEDIHNLMNMSKKTHVAKTMANYYGKLALVFWKAGHCLFHAAALLKLFQISKELKKNLTPEELQSLACTVLVAVLSIPLPSLHPEFDRFIETDKSPVEKAQRLAVLLGLQQPPTRASLLKEIVRLNVVNLATRELQDLYTWLEVEFNPLGLCKKVKVVIDSLEKEEGSPLCQYVSALRDVGLIRLVRQVAQCYQSIRFARLLELAVFADPFHLERLLVDCVRHNDMQIRIDHANKCVQFGVELSEAARESVPEGPFLQEMPSEQVRGQLIRAAQALGKAAAIVGPKKRRVERERARQQSVQHYHENKVREHQRVLQRHKIIEDRKEYIEMLNTVREEEEQRRQEEIVRQQQLVEQMRLASEQEEREKRRQQTEIQQIKDRHLKEKMHQISMTAHGQKVLKKLDEEVRNNTIDNTCFETGGKSHCERSHETADQNICQVDQGPCDAGSVCSFENTSPTNVTSTRAYHLENHHLNIICQEVYQLFSNTPKILHHHSLKPLVLVIVEKNNNYKLRECKDGCEIYFNHVFPQPSCTEIFVAFFICSILLLKGLNTLNSRAFQKISKPKIKYACVLKSNELIKSLTCVVHNVPAQLLQCYVASINKENASSRPPTENCVSPKKQNLVYNSAKIWDEIIPLYKPVRSKVDLFRYSYRTVKSESTKTVGNHVLIAPLESIQKKPNVKSNNVSNKSNDAQNVGISAKTVNLQTGASNKQPNTMNINVSKKLKTNQTLVSPVKIVELPNQPSKLKSDLNNIVSNKSNVKKVKTPVKSKNSQPETSVANVEQSKALHNLETSVGTINSQPGPSQIMSNPPKLPLSIPEKPKTGNGKNDSVDILKNAFEMFKINTDDMNEYTAHPELDDSSKVLIQKKRSEKKATGRSRKVKSRTVNTDVKNSPDAPKIGKCEWFNPDCYNGVEMWEDITKIYKEISRSDLKNCIPKVTENVLPNSSDGNIYVSIAKVGYPRAPTSFDEYSRLKNSITMELLKCFNLSGPIPKFTKYELVNGVTRVLCTDTFTADWLRNFVSNRDGFQTI